MKKVEEEVDMGWKGF